MKITFGYLFAAALAAIGCQPDIIINYYGEAGAPAADGGAAGSGGSGGSGGSSSVDAGGSGGSGGTGGGSGGSSGADAGTDTSPVSPSRIARVSGSLTETPSGTVKVTIQSISDGGILATAKRGGATLAGERVREICIGTESGSWGRNQCSGWKGSSESYYWSNVPPGEFGLFLVDTMSEANPPPGERYWVQASMSETRDYVVIGSGFKAVLTK